MLSPWQGGLTIRFSSPAGVIAKRRSLRHMVCELQGRRLVMSVENAAAAIASTSAVGSGTFDDAALAAGLLPKWDRQVV